MAKTGGQQSNMRRTTFASKSTRVGTGENALGPQPTLQPQACHASTSDLTLVFGLLLVNE